MTDAESTYEEVEIDRVHGPKVEDGDTALEVDGKIFTKLIISLYKNSPILWNIDHKFYSLKEKRRKAVDRIVGVLRNYKPDFDEHSFKTKINILRTNFNKELRKIVAKNADGEMYEPVLWYFRDLLFLKDEDERQQAIDEAKRRNEALFVPTSMPMLEVRPMLATSKTRVPRKRALSSIDDTITPQKDDWDPLCVAPDPEMFDTATIKSERRSSIADTDRNTSIADTDRNTSIADTDRNSVSEYDAVGINVAKKLQKMDPDQAIYAESIINNVLRNGLLKRLTDETDLCTRGCANTKYISLKCEVEDSDN